MQHAIDPIVDPSMTSIHQKQPKVTPYHYIPNKVMLKHIPDVALFYRYPILYSHILWSPQLSVYVLGKSNQYLSHACSMQVPEFRHCPINEVPSKYSADH